MYSLYPIRPSLPAPSHMLMESRYHKPFCELMGMVIVEMKSPRVTNPVIGLRTTSPTASHLPHSWSRPSGSAPVGSSPMHPRICAFTPFGPLRLKRDNLIPERSSTTLNRTFTSAGPWEVSTDFVMSEILVRRGPFVSHVPFATASIFSTVQRLMPSPPLMMSLLVPPTRTSLPSLP